MDYLWLWRHLHLWQELSNELKDNERKEWVSDVVEDDSDDEEEIGGDHLEKPDRASRCWMPEETSRSSDAHEIFGFSHKVTF